MENVHELILHLQRKLVVLIIVLLLLATKATSSDDHQPMMNIAKPGCQNSCGSVSIPYPFGTSPKCCYDKSFLITCKQTSNNTITSQPFFPHSNVSILNISLENGELRVASFISRKCYTENQTNLTGDTVSYSENYMITNSSFPLSTRNKFTAVGCDTLAVVEGRRGETYGTACLAFCDKDQVEKAVNDGSCSGIGCCQMNVPRGVVDYDIGVLVGYAYNESFVSHDFSPCGYAFVVEDGVYNFSWSDLKGLQKKDDFPVVLDWAIANLTCKQAMKNPTRSYACLARKSRCLDSTDPVGYRCKCLDGFQGNPYLPDGCQDVDECKSTPNPCNTTTSKCVNLLGSFKCLCSKGYEGDGRRYGTVCVPIDGGKDNYAERFYIALCICIGLLALLVGGSWIYWGLKKRRVIKLKQKFFEQNGGLLLQQQLPSTDRVSTGTTKIFTADELNNATNNYDVKRVLGQGGYGTVYKGVLADNKVVAIKKSKIGDQRQIEQFINEVIVLSQINHRNVVKLLGCCLETEVPLLVYEFITNGTLFEHIHGRGQYFQLSWEMRLKIATETAGAIAYLHSSTSMPIIHRDIKTANILLDENYNAKVSDFGASRLVPLDQTQLTTLVQGTLGYLDPEYLHTSQLTEKSDVYSFGVVLAEILTSQKALSFQREECDINLATYFVSSMKEDHQLLRILDENLVNAENVWQLKVVANVAKSCVRVRGEDRPTMKEVAIELEALKEKARIHPWEKDDHALSSEETEHFLNTSGGVQDIHGGNSKNTSTSGFDSLCVEIIKHEDVL